jgi:phage replication-related protein YjqB (UPF0714/DUF867 family)
MDRSNPYFDRREFLLALGAGLPLLAQGCGETEDLEFRGGEADLVAMGPLPGLITSIDVERALTSQPIITSLQGCSVPESMAVTLGDQVRVTRNSKEFAIFTVDQKRKKDNHVRVRMGLDARLRLSTSKEFSATLSIPVVTPGLTDAEARAANEFVERLVDDGSNTGLVVIAPHGGTIEFDTDRQAEAITLALACSSWICKGWRSGGGAYDRWHISSTRLSPNSFPGLALIADRGFAYSVAFHGMSSGGVLIGGTASLEVREMVRAAILAELSDTSIPVTVASEHDKYNGDSPTNVVNWLTQGGSGGVQIEQGPKVRNEHWQEVAAGVMHVFEQLV